MLLLIILTLVFVRCYKRCRTEKAGITATTATVQVSQAAVSEAAASKANLEMESATSDDPIDHSEITAVEIAEGSAGPSTSATLRPAASMRETKI